MRLHPLYRTRLSWCDHQVLENRGEEHQVLAALEKLAEGNAEALEICRSLYFLTHAGILLSPEGPAEPWNGLPLDRTWSPLTVLDKAGLYGVDIVTLHQDVCDSDMLFTILVLQTAGADWGQFVRRHVATSETACPGAVTKLLLSALPDGGPATLRGFIHNLLRREQALDRADPETLETVFFCPPGSSLNPEVPGLM
ncbi:MAG: hypothetical protein M3O22_01855 [Pseudomonadota bacterium]|nr:hypothetical protein [Pseudomonadota bacterium]